MYNYHYNAENGNMKRLYSQKREQNEYVKGDPYFCQTENIRAYPYVDKDMETDILIIGGGIIGAITNFHLSKKYDCLLVDKSRFGYGCTSCATVLLEYQLDDYADELLKYMSEEDIVRIYKMGQTSIQKFDAFIKTYGNHCHYSKRPSLLYTNNILGMNAIEKEYQFRIKHGFKAKLFDEKDSPLPSL